MLVVGYCYHGLNDNKDPMIVVAVVVVEVGKNIAGGFAAAVVVVVVDEILVEKIETVEVQIEDTAVKIVAVVIVVMFDHIVLL